MILSLTHHEIVALRVAARYFLDDLKATGDIASADIAQLEMAIERLSVALETEQDRSRKAVAWPARQAAGHRGR